MKIVLAKNRERLEKFVAELKKVKKLHSRYINYYFDYKCRDYKESYCEIDEFRCTVNVYFHSNDSFEKWVDVFVLAEVKIDEAITLHDYLKKSPIDFDYIKNNLQE